MNFLLTASACKLYESKVHTHLKLVLMATNMSPLLLPKVVWLDDVYRVYVWCKALRQLLQDWLYCVPCRPSHVNYHREASIPRLITVGVNNSTLCFSFVSVVGLVVGLSYLIYCLYVYCNPLETTDSNKHSKPLVENSYHHVFLRYPQNQPQAPRAAKTN